MKGQIPSTGLEIMVLLRHRHSIALLALSVALLLGIRYPASSEPAAVAAAKSDAEGCNRATFRVAVDVGHTAKGPGALSARGAWEYEFNLRLAQQIEKSLLDAGFAKTALLVSTDPHRSALFNRAARANGLGADLFLSIHHDSVPNRFLEVWQYDGTAHHFSDRFKGHSIFVSKDNSNFKASLLFGQLLGKQLKDRGLQYTPHYVEKFMGRYRRILVDAEVGVYRYDQLIVLRSARMPAVLLEAGSIINRDEELQMVSPERQALITAAVTDAVEGFCAARSSRPVAAAQPVRRPERARR
jgi:N-acetylmuramoyl-L-alanine amidase